MEKSLMARAVDLLSRREYSRRELAQKLKPHAESEEQLSALLDQLSARTWQSDQRTAEQYIRAKSSQYGRLRLYQALREKGLEPEVIEQALVGLNDLETALAVWRRKFGSPAQTLQEKARHVRFLASRGFPAEVIRQVLAGAIDEFED